MCARARRRFNGNLSVCSESPTVPPVEERANVSSFCSPHLPQISLCPQCLRSENSKPRITDLRTSLSMSFPFFIVGLSRTESRGRRTDEFPLSSEALPKSIIFVLTRYNCSFRAGFADLSWFVLRVEEFMALFS